MKRVQDCDTDYLKHKKSELLELISICDTYIDSANGSFLGTLAMKAERKRFLNQLNEIIEELTARNEYK